MGEEFFFIIPLKSQYFKRNYSTTERKSLNASVGTSRCCVRRDERARLVPNNSNSPSYSMALKGRKSLPNRLSSVNSYNFVIRENCRKCKTTVPNCDLSKLMPLITVAGETWGKLELGPRPSLLPWGGLVQATLPQLARQLRLAHVVLPPSAMASLLGKSWLLLAFRAALCGEQALMKEKRLSSWLLLVSRCTEPSWRARAKRGEARGS